MEESIKAETEWLMQRAAALFGEQRTEAIRPSLEEVAAAIVRLRIVTVAPEDEP